MKKKLQVFVSSTYTDMLAERQATVEAILQAGHIPAGMELFASGDESQWETIRQWIDESDVFMLILGGRYGTVEPKSQKSYIQLEYEYAVQAKKPLFAAVISDKLLDAKTRQGGLDVVEKVNGHLLQQFREVVTSKICRFFNDVTELKLIVFQSLGQARYDELPGWIRGSDVVDPTATLQELERLQKENAELRLQIAEVVPETERVSISDDAWALLLEAADADGYIMYFPHIGVTAIQVGKRNFIEHEGDPREVARWKAALEELVTNGLVDELGETFRVSHQGYKAVDQIREIQ